MRILFLGTGAADWPLQSATNCEHRRQCSALVDDCLLIDPNRQSLDALAKYGKSAEHIKYVIYTHKHADHYCEDTVERLTRLGAVLLRFSDGDSKKAGVHYISAHQGNHATAKETVHFIIKNEASTLFYGLDGAWLTYDEVQAIKRSKPDLAVLDATVGDVDGDYRIFEHNNLNMVLEMQKTLKPYIKRFCISHMARTLHTDHKTLEARMMPYDVTVAYDGLEIEI